MPFFTFYEVAVPEGLEPIALDEINHRFRQEIQLIVPMERQRPGLIQFIYGGKATNLLQLKTVLSLFRVLRFPVPRPKALLGHQNFQILQENIQTILRHYPGGTFRSLHLAAAGSETSVMQRFAQEVAVQNKLRVTTHEGDLLLRVRRPLDGSEGWEVAIRMSPRPLSVRPWRVCDYTGALNAAVARAMIQLTVPRNEDVFFNLACGSGTLLAERASSPYRLALGCDKDSQALTCARDNLKAARVQSVLAQWDVTHLPLADASVDVLVSDLPFGHDVGSHDENLLLYPRLLKEAERVARMGARAVFLTHEIRLMNSIIERSLEWDLEVELPITINGLHPHIYCLTRQ